MRIGVSLASSHGVRDGRDGARRMIERTRVARDAGLWCLTVGDHHVNARTYYQNVPILGRLLAEWGDERPAGCLFLLPLWSPVLLAEQVGTLATCAGEPFIVQTGIGWGPTERQAMGVGERPRGEVADAMIPLVKALLAGETCDDDYFGVRGAHVSPVPPGAVEWWIGATAPAGIDRAARLGDCWYAGPECSVAEAGARAQRYHERCAAHGTTPRRLPIRQDVYVAATDEEAEAVVQPLLARGYRGLRRDQVAVGSPATVAERFAAYAAAGFTDIIVRQMNVTQDQALSSYELLGEVRRLVADL